MVDELSVMSLIRRLSNVDPDNKSALMGLVECARSIMVSEDNRKENRLEEIELLVRLVIWTVEGRLEAMRMYGGDYDGCDRIHIMLARLKELS